VIIEDDESVDNNNDFLSSKFDLNQTQKWSLDHKIVELTDKEHLDELKRQMVEIQDGLDIELRKKQRKI
jgi:hypothetical protein